MNAKLRCIALAALLCATPAGAYDLIQNGGFQTGSLSGWQLFNQGASGGQGSWYAHSGGNGTYSGLPTNAPLGGWQAVADNNGRAAAILYQDVTIPATTRATLSFTLGYGNATPSYVNGSSLSPSSTNQRVRVDVIATGTPLLQTSSGVLQLVHASGPGSPAVFGPSTISQDLTALAGQTVRLRFALVGTNGGIIASLDNVKLDVSPFVLQGSLIGLYTAPARWGNLDDAAEMEVVKTGGDDFSMYGVWHQYQENFGWAAGGNLFPLAHGGFDLGDVDRDGDLDFVAAGWTTRYAHDFVVALQQSLYDWTVLNPGVIFFEPGTRFGTVALGDKDTDGDLDALVTGDAQTLFSGDQPITGTSENAGGGWFGSVYSAVPGVNYGQAAWHDLSNDGVLGVAVCGSGVAELFRADGAGGYTSEATGLPGVTKGAIAMGDLDNDGVEEVVLTGLNGATPIARVYRRGAPATPWTDLGVGLPGVYDSWVSLGDFDNDGRVDIALCGDTGGVKMTRVYRNNANGTFTDIQAGLPGVTRGSVEFGDFEGDGDLDLLVHGHTGADRITHVYLNSTSALNMPPTPPTGLLGFMPWPGAVWLAFTNYGTDDHTTGDLLTHNYRVGTSPGAIDIISPMSNLVTGRRMLPRPGESRFTGFRQLPMLGIGHGCLYWSVQTVDPSYNGSAWAPENVFTVGPTVVQVQDVPGDQGGRVRLTMTRSPLDIEGVADYPAAGYNVWRLVTTAATTRAVASHGTALEPASVTARLRGLARGGAATPVSNASDAGSQTDLSLVEWNGRVFTRSEGLSMTSAFPAGTWEIVGSFYANQQSSYLVATTTEADSGAAGANDATFVVSVHSTTPSVWFTSPPAIGHSVDNLAPAAPVGLTAAHHTGSGNQLAWQPAPEPDFASFRVYRGTTPGFVAGPATLVASVTGPTWTDPSYDAPIVYYKVSTVDHAGNASPAVAPGSTTDVEGPGLPIAFALRSVSPNPFGASTRFGFALPHASDVRLDVFDTAGRLVRTVVEGRLPAGEHEAEWGGEDDRGVRGGPGVYFCRLRAGTLVATRRVVFVP